MLMDNPNDDYKNWLESKYCNRKSRSELREHERQKAETLIRVWKYKARKEQEMDKKEFVNGIYVKKFPSQYGDMIAISIKNEDGTYSNYKFFQKREQKNEKYTEYYGVVDNWKPEKKEEDIVKFEEN